MPLGKINFHKSRNQNLWNITETKRYIFHIAPALYNVFVKKKV